MRFRTGVLIGLGVGYYFGARAGHERYDEIEAWLDRLRGLTAYQDLQIKVSDGWREGTTVARRMVADTAFGGGADDPTAPMNLSSLFSDPTLN
jgi:hypothetical protein